MRKDLGAKPNIYPMPVLIIGTYDEKGIPNLMNAAWGGISNDYEICLCLSANHKTTRNLLKTKAITVSIATLPQMAKCDYVGIVSGNKVEDKVEKCGFHTFKAPHINAPMVTELPYTLECEVTSYDEESCHLFANIINISVDEEVLTEGKVDIQKLQPIAFDPNNHQYLLVDKIVGEAFKIGKTIK